MCKAYRALKLSSSSAQLCSDLWLFADAHGEQKVSLQLDLQPCAWVCFLRVTLSAQIAHHVQVDAWKAPTNISAWKEEHVSVSASKC